ncbi:nucleotidyltransferase family protein [Chitinophaga sp. LS1]|uniref:nucleotidyltransferase family protein n=1 Tax=Chitinophaga sp. LS1 TaxID=3051176 RepID=UPI002AAAD0DD|nr:nucleotidyltransferase family protein [Chitinophaga sp. LS1]WPV64867.1 nucleotidyltransferase family protein [Chitinophaga sp. LS1]
MNSYGVLILGAGNSSRLGQPKQLLRYQGRTLIRQMGEEAIAAVDAPVMVVTGANADLVEEALRELPIEVVENDHWEEGMSSSIGIGVTELQLLHPELSNIIIMVCDQPFVNAGLLRQLIQHQIVTGKGIVGATYENTIGTPVLFGSDYFPALKELNGQDGIRQILRQSTGDIAIVSFPLGALDIDTAEDYQQLLKR